MEEVIKYKNDEDLWAEFILNNEIGYGSYGKVYMWHLKWCDEKLNFPSTLACKVWDKEEIDEYIIQREKELWMSSEGKNLIKIYCVLQNKSWVYFFFHFYNGGTLKELIKLKDKLDEKLVARIIEQILKGLIELHNKGIIHRDLKPDNILLHFEWMNPNQKVNKQFIKEWSFEKHWVFSVIIDDPIYN